MKYKILIKCPWGEVGDIFPSKVFKVNEDINPNYGLSFISHEEIRPADYPQIFQPIEEKSDEILLSDWLSCNWYIFPGEIAFDVTSKLLLSENAINPDFLTKLRGGVDRVNTKGCLRCCKGAENSACGCLCHFQKPKDGE